MLQRSCITGASRAYRYTATQAFSLCCTRNFSQTFASKLRTSELQDDHLSSLRCNSERLWRDIHDTARWGTGRKYGNDHTQTGLSRLTLTDSDKSARDWFAETAKSLNCEVKVDQMGNTFAVRPGLNNDAPPTFAGSHLDSQPAGGRFDGVLGVCAGVEMLRVLNDNWIETEGPVGVVNWTNEEGARFPVSMMGSGVWAYPDRLQKTYDIAEVGEGKSTVLEELKRIGYQGELPASHEQGMKMGGHFELHIEQGPKLEQDQLAIGAVMGVQAYRWFEIDIQGRAAHSGATSLDRRADALCYAADIINGATEEAVQRGGLATFGVIRAEPGSVNTVAERVVMTIDIRAPDDDKLQTLVEAIWKRAEDSLSRKNDIQLKKTQNNPALLKMTKKEIFSSPATKFDSAAIDCVKQSAQNVLKDGNDRIPEMISGAGHDSVNTSKHCPTAMIFVPCKNGISHEPVEWCNQENCATGADVLLQSVLRFDQYRHKQGHLD